MTSAFSARTTRPRFGFGGFLSILAAFVLMSAAGSAFATDARRVRFSNSVGPLPSEAARSVRELRSENLGETLEVEIPLKMRGYAQLLEKIGRGERVTQVELERDHLPSAADYEAVRQWLVQQGFTITQTDPNRLSIFARGTMSRIQQSLQVEMVKVTVSGATYNAARTHPSLPEEIAGPVLGVNGLQPYLKAHRHLVQPSPSIANQPPYLVSEVLGAYNATGLGVTGAGQTIAILIDSVPRNSDLTNFWSQNKISQQSLTNIEKVNVNGTLPTDTEGEATLDVEWSSSVAPNAVIRIYATGDLSFTDIDKALQQIISDLPSQPNLHQLSISLGLGETYLAGSSETQTESQFFATLAASGVSVFVASGDAGSNPDSSGHNDASSPGPLQVEYEASDPSVTGVGGTNLILNSATGTVTSETGWSGSGGGVSQVFSRPSWQKGTGVPSGSMRLVPDVSLVASDTTYAYLYFQGKATGVAGTSWSAPTWAGFAALINEARANRSQVPLGLLNPQIYPLIGTSNFRDITSGSNGSYTAGVGYDRVTGIGVPNMSTLLTTLAGGGSAVPSITSFNPTSGAPGTSVTIYGVNLSRVTAVKFNGTTAVFTSNSATQNTQLTATVPVGATTGPITVVASTDSAASASSFKVLPATPSNDNFASAQTITGNSGTTTGSNVGGTKETGEPDHAGDAGGHSIWYSWTAPQTGIYTFDTAGSSFDTLLAIYTGSSVDSLTLVAANNDAGTGVTSATSFSASAGTTYKIAVDGSGGQTGSVMLNWALNTSTPTINSFVPASGAPGSVVTINGASLSGATAVTFGGAAAVSYSVDSPTQITATVPSGATTGVVSVTTTNGTGSSAGVFTVLTPPGNDTFAMATTVTGDSGTIAGSNVGATKETGEPNHAGNPGGHSVWYSWTAPADAGNASFNTFGSSFDTILAVYTGTAVNALTEVASNDDAGSGITSTVAFAAIPGTTYKIAVDGAGGVVGNIVLNWSANVPAPAISSFTPASAGPGTTVTISGAGFSSVQEVDFNGGSASYVILSDTQIAATVPASATSGPISVTSISGTATSVDSFTVNSAPANDDFADAATFAGTGVVSGTNVSATKEANEPNHAGNDGGASVWWKWTAPTTGDYNISTLGSNFDTLLGIYTGTDVASLTTVASDDNDPSGGQTSFLVLHAIAGTVYDIAVDGANGVTGTIELSITPVSSDSLFSTGFEAAEGYSTALSLAGQNGWLHDGNGQNGILSGAFPGMGQQAYIGKRNGDPRGTFVWKPINYTPQGGDKITFHVAFEITDSTSGSRDDFVWAVYNIGTNPDLLFAIHFDNSQLSIGYELDDGTGVQSTGFAFDNFTIYTLTVAMDFGNNLWSASVNNTQIVSNQPLTTTGAPLNLGDVDAVWSPKSSFRPGSNEMIFDNYSIAVTHTEAPKILLQPQPQTVFAGNSVSFAVVPTGSEPFQFQWEKDGAAINGATSAILTLANAQPEDQGNYSVIVSNGAGSVTSDAAVLTVDLPQMPNLAPAKPSGWSDRVVVSKTQGATTDDVILSSTDVLYVDWAIENEGLTSAGSFQSSLYVDGVLKNIWKQNAMLTPGSFAEATDYAIGQLSPGTHTVEIVADSANQVAEYNEADNGYTKTIIVTNPAGDYVIGTASAPANGGTTSGGGVYKGGSKVTLTASPATGFRFVGWTGATGVASAASSFHITVTKDINLVANFVPETTAGAPVITISVPTQAAAYNTIRNTITLAGSAAGNNPIRVVAWSNDRGGSGKAAGTALWSIPSIPLLPGENVITIAAYDTHSASGVTTLTVNAAGATDFSGNYVGTLISQGGDQTYAGMAKFAVTSGGNFTGSVWIGGKKRSVVGRFGPDGSYLAASPASGPNALVLNLSLVSGTNASISGTVSDPDGTLILDAARAEYNAKTHPFPQAGRYTFIFQPDPTDIAAPVGNGIGTAKIDASGNVTMTARLADGSAFSESVLLTESSSGPLAAENSWPLYGALYQGTGFIAGQVAIQATAPMVSGVADWHKPANAKSGKYAVAINTTVSLNGDRFGTPAGTTTVIKAGNRQLTLSAGDLASADTESVSLLAPNHFKVAAPNNIQLQLAITTTTGLISGQFVHPVTGKEMHVYGVVLQRQDTAAGFFLGPSKSGSLEIGAPQ